MQDGEPNYWESAINGYIGSPGTYHTSVADWNGSGWDVKIDGWRAATGNLNRPRLWNLSAGLESLHCWVGNGGEYNVSDGMEQKDWRWWESNGTGHALNPPESKDVVTLPAHLWRYTVNGNPAVCAHLNTEDRCDDF